MTSRFLPREEWHRLNGTLLWPAVRGMDPGALVVVVEDAGEIQACAAFYQQWHLDGVWIRPEASRMSVGRKLWRLVREGLELLQLRSVWAMATTPRSRKLVQSLGPTLHLDCEHYEVSTRGE